MTAWREAQQELLDLCQKNEESMKKREEETVRQERKPYPIEYDRVPYPETYQTPQFRLFTGENKWHDTEAHLIHFKHYCKETRGNDCYLLRQFPSSLYGPALEWYCSLKTDSILTWDNMASAFKAKFTRQAIMEAHCEAIKRHRKRKSREAAERENPNKKIMECIPLSVRLSRPYSFKKDKIWEIALLAVKQGFPLRLTEGAIKSQENETHTGVRPKFCAYHVKRGHSLEDCFVFKDWIEDRYQEGTLYLPEHVIQEPASHK